MFTVFVVSCMWHSIFSPDVVVDNEDNEIVQIDKPIDLPQKTKIYKDLYNGLISLSYTFPLGLYDTISITLDSHRNPVTKRFLRKKYNLSDMSKDILSLVGFIHFFENQKIIELPIEHQFFNSLIQRHGGTNTQKISVNIEWKLEVALPNGWEDDCYRGFSPKYQSDYNLLFIKFKYLATVALNIREKYVDYIEQKNHVDKCNIGFLLEMAHLFEILSIYLADHQKFDKSLSRSQRKKYHSYSSHSSAKVNVSLSIKSNYNINKNI